MRFFFIECDTLQTKLAELEMKTSAPPPSDVKVASLGAKKKQRAKKEKNAEPAEDESKDAATSALQAQVDVLIAQRDSLEAENANLKTASQELEEKLATAHQRVQLLMTELQADTGNT